MGYAITQIARQFGGTWLYLDDDDTVYLDNWFSAEELREIADWIDQERKKKDAR